MIAIDNILVSDEIILEQFVCDLAKCKGGCCDEGDAGAPLEDAELEKLTAHYEIVKPYLTPEGISEMEKQGKYVFDEHFGWVTPTIGKGLCTYAFHDNSGVIKCAIEQAYYAGKTDWKKPVSCHLFPVKIEKSKIDEHLEYVNYEPRTELCAPACKLGNKLKMPVYVFLKEALIRKYGQDFYEALDATAKHLSEL
ncbi:MAG: DUF3109 family protein [Chitinophagaceae bacterium]|jgi:hypothetical protein|nr:DUF3109 family protein [Chitinophagaceae bacterium]